MRRFQHLCLLLLLISVGSDTTAQPLLYPVTPADQEKNVLVPVIEYESPQIKELLGQGAVDQVFFTALLSNPTPKPIPIYYKIQMDDVAAREIIASYRDGFLPSATEYPLLSDSDPLPPECAGTPCILLPAHSVWLPRFTIYAPGIEKYKSFNLTLATGSDFAPGQSQSLTLNAIPARLNISGIEDAVSMAGDNIEFAITLNRRPGNNDTLALRLQPEDSNSLMDTLDLQQAFLYSAAGSAEKIDLSEPQGSSVSLQGMLNKQLWLVIPARSPDLPLSIEQKFTLLATIANQASPLKTAQAQGVIEPFGQFLALQAVAGNEESSGDHYQLAWQYNKLPLSHLSFSVREKIQARNAANPEGLFLYLTMTAPDASHSEYYPLTPASDGKLNARQSHSLLTTWQQWQQNVLTEHKGQVIPFYFGEWWSIENSVGREGLVKVVTRALPLPGGLVDNSTIDEQKPEAIQNSRSLLILSPRWD
ncbi:MAG: hypothetical protein ACRC5A_00560 [Enterobacteriaceae bacterium]